MFGDGKGAMQLMGQWLLGAQGTNAADGKGQPIDNIGILSFPDAARRQGQADRHSRRHQRLARHQGCAERDRRLPEILQPGKISERSGGRGRLYPGREGDRKLRSQNPLFKQIAADLAATTYHQNFFDQDLGPSVGRVVNDISVAVAAGEMKPEDAAAAIQDAFEQQ